MSLEAFGVLVFGKDFFFLGFGFWVSEIQTSEH